MAHVKIIKVGTTAERLAYTPAVGELFLDTTIAGAGAAVPTADALFTGSGAAGGKNLAPTSAVASVFTRTGAIVAANGDYTAGQITNVPSGNLVGVTVQAALDELQTEVDGLTLLSANDYLSGAGAPAAALGIDGQGYLNRTNGDIYEKAAGAWTITGNAYAQLGLSAVAGAAPSAAGAAGTATVAARGDHSHPFQSAASTPSTAAGNLAATNVDAALAELQASIDTTDAAAVTLAGTVATLNAASHAHTATPLAVLETIGNPVVGDVGKSVKVTAAGTLGLVADAATDFSTLTTVTTHDGAADFVVLQTAAGPRKITINNLMNAN